MMTAKLAVVRLTLGFSNGFVSVGNIFWTTGYI